MRKILSSGRNRLLFDNSRAFHGAISGHHRLVAQYETKTIDGAPCIVAHSYQALVRAIGYFMYNGGGTVLLRGQTKCHLNLNASIHRREPRPSDADVESFLARCRAAVGFDQDPGNTHTTEALLQHYGVRTRWLDAVDSVPHALFFACHEFVESPTEKGSHTFVPSRGEFAFVYVLDVGAQRPYIHAGKEVRGVSEHGDIRVVDLRRAKPSLALRPHAQHGLLVRSLPGLDLWDALVARIAVPIPEARRWIAAEAFDPETLFPDRIWDGVFGKFSGDAMRDFLTSEGSQWGQIHRYDFHAR